MKTTSWQKKYWTDRNTSTKHSIGIQCASANTDSEFVYHYFFSLGVISWHFVFFFFFIGRKVVIGNHRILNELNVMHLNGISNVEQHQPFRNCTFRPLNILIRSYLSERKGRGIDAKAERTQWMDLIDLLNSVPFDIKYSFDVVLCESVRIYIMAKKLSP